MTDEAAYEASRQSGGASLVHIGMFQGWRHNCFKNMERREAGKSFERSEVSRVRLGGDAGCLCAQVLILEASLLTRHSYMPDGEQQGHAHLQGRTLLSSCHHALGS